MTTVLNEFVENTKILPTPVNENFSGLQQDIADVNTTLSGNITTLSTTVTSLSNTVAGITTPSSSFKATLLGLLYPIGSIYLTIDTSSTCPIQTQLGGTWELVSTDRVLQGASTVAGAGGTKAAGLPNITGNFGGSQWHVTYSLYANGALATGGVRGCNCFRGDEWKSDICDVSFDASRSSSIYGNSSTVQPPAYLVNVWKRTA